MRVDPAALLVLSMRLRVGVLGTAFVHSLSSDEGCLCEHTCHEIGHAMLLGGEPEQALYEPMLVQGLTETVAFALRGTTDRRQYRDEAHVLVATFRLLASIYPHVRLHDFELVSKHQKIKRHEWRAALRSPRARVLERDLRRYLVDAGVLVAEGGPS